MRKIVLDFDWDFFVQESPVLDLGHSESNPLFANIAWMARAGNPDLNDWLHSPHDVDPSNMWKDLRDRGWIMDHDVQGFATNSHATVGEALPDLMGDDHQEEWEIWHFDAHHDLGYVPEKDHLMISDGDPFECDNFLLGLAHRDPRIKKIVVVYPEWRRSLCPITGRDWMYELHPDHNPDLIQKIQDNLPEGCVLEVCFYNDHKPPKEPFQVLTVAQSSSWTPPWWDSMFSNFLQSAPVDDLEEAFGPDEDDTFEIRPGWPLTWEEHQANQGHWFKLMKK